MDVQKQPHKRRPLPTKLGKIFRAFRNEQDKNMGDMAADLGCSKSYLSQVEIGKIAPSLELLEKYIEVYQLGEAKAYRLFGAAYENWSHITINMNDLRILDREYFSKLLAIIKFFPAKITEYNTKAYHLRDAIDAIWKLSIPDPSPKTAPPKDAPPDTPQAAQAE
jgi:transcriptional regulator with XRE-family HTH domain